MRLIAAAAVLSLGLLPAAGQDRPKPTFAGGQEAFALRLLAQLAKDAPGKNVVVGPSSISLGLGMAREGARGDTLAAMDRVLGLEGLDPAAVASGYAALQKESADPRVSVTTANSAWVRSGVELLPPFVEALKGRFGATPSSQDFASPEAAKAINDWVSKATKGLIPSIVESPISPEIFCILVNAVHFKGAWTTPFDSKLTREAPFRRLDGSSSKVPMMHRHGRELASIDDAGSALRLPYGKGGRHEMQLLMPGPKEDFAAWLAGLTPAKVAERLASAQEQTVNVALPRLKLEGGFALKPALSALGMEAAFDPGRADFGGMLAQRAWISAVAHKAVLLVDEEGTTAAAATAVKNGTLGMPPSFRADRPFVALIRDLESGAILFAAAVLDP